MKHFRTSFLKTPKVISPVCLAWFWFFNLQKNGSKLHNPIYLYTRHGSDFAICLRAYNDDHSDAQIWSFFLPNNQQISCHCAIFLQKNGSKLHNQFHLYIRHGSNFAICLPGFKDDHCGIKTFLANSCHHAHCSRLYVSRVTKSTNTMCLRILKITYI